MEMRYKLLISSQNLYKEVELPPDVQTVHIGTETGCDVRLHRERFFESFELSAVQNQDEWQIICSDNIYLDTGDVRKVLTKKLKHGDTFKVRYQKSDYVLLTVEFLIDFGAAHQNYEGIIDISGRGQISIGSMSAGDIVIRSRYAQGESVVLRKINGGFKLKVIQTGCGIYRNGAQVNEETFIGDHDFFSIADCSFYYSKERLYATNFARLSVNGLPCRLLRESASSLVYPCFNRSTHPENELLDEPIQILDPPAKPQKPEGGLLASLLPAITMLVLVIVIRGFMSNSSNITYILFSVCSMTIGIITSVMNFIKNKKKYKQELQDRETSYSQYIERKKNEITEARREEADLLNQEYPDEEKNLALVNDFSGDLFDRSKERRSFLHIRLGNGSAEAVRKITVHNREQIVPEDEIEKLPGEVAEQFRMVQNIPVTCDLIQARNIGIVGEDAACYELMKVMTLDLCVHHYAKDVRAFYVFEPSRKNQMQWLRFLPHVQNEADGGRSIVCDEESKAVQFEYLYKELCRRETMGDRVPAQWIVVFLFDEMGILQHPVSRFLSTASEYHVHFISFANYMEQLPMYCGQIVRLKGAAGGVLIETSTAMSTEFAYHQVDDRRMQKLSARLAPVYCKEIALESTLTKSITFFQMLGIFSPEDLNLDNRWGSEDICRTMAAPIGVKSKNEIVCLDLHEKAHGPHGLVAGTTGSGKSELLQTYILSMALQFSPYEVGFVLIDFKGGGMANQFRELPHLSGVITDIDGVQINRSLLSIRAELDRRKELFSVAGVNNISEYIRKYRTGDIKTALPHLIIIVDEFAELKAEQPEFMKELISASRIGRSLGVHLILATQKPSGQVSDQIWSNSRFKLCLKVQSQSDSNEVIKSPLAAEIIEPGRAYFQVGNNEIFELIQSAYSGAPEKQTSDDIEGKEFDISEVDLAGRHKVIFSQRRKSDGETRRSQLDAIVAYVRDYCERKHMDKLPAICLPPLPEYLAYPKVIQRTEEKGTRIRVNIGLYDAPGSQYQGPLEILLSGRNTVIIGSSQYGKTNLLQTMIRGLADNYTPEDVNIYILDFGSMFLKNYEELPHVGGVVCAADDEKLRNLFKLLNKEIVVRKDRLMEVGVSSFSAYREAGYTDIPFIVLMVDNFTALKETYFADDDPLLAICRDGTAVGISAVIANAQTGGFGYRYFSVMSNHVAFYCNEGDEINNIFGYCKERPAAVPGRCMVDIDKAVYQAQTYLAFDGKREIDRSLNVRTFVEQQKIRCGSMHAKYIPAVPEVLTSEMAYEFAAPVRKEDAFCVAIDYGDIESVVLPFDSQFMLAMMGGKTESRQKFVSVLMQDIRQNVFERDIELYFIDSVSKIYKDYADMPYMRQYTTHPESLSEIVEEVHEKLQQRYHLMEEQGESALDACPLELVIVNNRKAIDMLSADRACMKVYDDISQNLRQMKVMFIFTDVENASMPSGDLMKRIRDEQKALIFDALKNVKLYTNISIQMKNKSGTLGRSDAFYMNHDTVLRVKLAEEG